MGRRSEPDKFPLRLHASGQWCKTIRGRGHYFGTDRDKALARYVRDREDLEGGRVPRPRDEDAVTVKELANRVRHARRADVESGELSTRQWDEYRSTCETHVTDCDGSRFLDQRTDSTAAGPTMTEPRGSTDEQSYRRGTTRRAYFRGREFHTAAPRPS